MPARRLAIAAALAVAVGGSPASAKACNLLTDKGADAYTGPRAAGAGNVAPLDIKSVDVATGARTLVVVLRLASTKAGDSPLMAAGYYWRATFDLAGVPHTFERRVDHLGKAVDNGYASSQAIAEVTAKVDAGAITWTAPRANVAKLVSGRPVFSKFVGQTGTPRDVAGDRAPESGTATSRYVDRTASCVRAA